MRHKHRTGLNEQGFASIVIALILIIVLALLTVGFAQLARREQQDSLDKQLAAQANYAAESGINDAYKDILSGKITTANQSTSSCMKPGSGPSKLPNTALTAKQDVNTTSGVSYTCLLVNLTPDNLTFNDVTPGAGRHMTFSTNDNLSTLTIGWGSADGHTAYPTSPTAKLPPLNDWHDSAGHLYPPVIQFSITRLDSLDTQALIDNTFNVYLYPSSNAVAAVPFGSAQGQIVAGGCSGSGSYPCKVTLNGLGGKNYLIHFTDFYDASNMLVKGTTASGAATFTGEPLIDVTGKARDVLKRQQVRLLISGGNSADSNVVLPDNAIQAKNICKRIQAAPVVLPDNPDGSKYDTATDASCNLSSP